MLIALARRLAYLVLALIDKLPAPKPGSKDHPMQCPFCSIPSQAHLVSNALFYAIADHRPVALGHSLIVSRRHVENYFNLTDEEASALKELVSRVKDHLDELHHPSGYKLLMNCGAKAGQRVFHFHLHVIPFYG